MLACKEPLFPHPLVVKEIYNWYRIGKIDLANHGDMHISPSGLWMLTSSETRYVMSKWFHKGYEFSWEMSNIARMWKDLSIEIFNFASRQALRIWLQSKSLNHASRLWIIGDITHPPNIYFPRFNSLRWGCSLVSHSPIYSPLEKGATSSLVLTQLYFS